MLPLYEAKMIHHYDTRWATYEPDGSTRAVTATEKRDPDFCVQPRYWVHESEVDARLKGRWDKQWMLGWRDVARATDDRTFITAQVPRMPFGHKMLLAFSGCGRQEIQATWTSFVWDFVARQKLGGTSMSYFLVNQLPMPDPVALTPHRGWIADRVDRLNAQSLDVDDNASLRAELDALMFHVYGVGRDDADHILETFPIVKRKDLAAFGEYRTKRLILEAYDRLSDAATQ